MLQNLFQTLYKDADDDTKKAMMKSYQESGGTALSTNWKEVSAGKVPVQPYLHPTYQANANTQTCWYGSKAL